MPYLLNLVYLLLLLLAMPYLAWKSLRAGKYRAGWREKFLGRVPRRVGERPCIWLHAVSVGEVNLLPGLIRDLRRRRPEVECVVSTTTRTGMELARKRFPELSVFYCPLDFSWAVRSAVRRIRPDVLVLAELELWPNLIGAARAAGSRVAVVNGRLSENSFRGYRRIRPLVARLLRTIDLLAVQDETYAERFRQLGAPAERVCVTGSIKYDGAETNRDNPTTQALRRLAGLAEDDIVFLAGSTQEPEERLALDAWRSLAAEWPRLRLIVVPRHPERFDSVARMLDASGVGWRRRSELDACENPADARVLLVDVIGELGAWWGTARIAFVGGSMGSRGGQNMIEPAAYGAAVCFGPNTRNFRDVVTAMLAHNAAEVVEDGEGLARFVRRMLENPNEAGRLGGSAQALVRNQQGATARTGSLLSGLLEKVPARPVA
ncbi:MAG TPA: 3-deoxy-D-manno-octulosonic acid transferase [Planctomycetaceae bacterium]|nr:3-deoxy-D-manno-octulosonic acid transferase [Planctomycetaceae bacterium]